MNLPLPGDDCILRIAADQPTQPSLLVEGVRLSSWKISHKGVEVTDMSDAGWTRLLSGAGLRSLELKLAGLFLGSEGEIRLRALAFSGSAADCTLSLSQGTALRGNFIVSEMQFESVVNEEATYASTLRSSGPVSIS